MIYETSAKIYIYIFANNTSMIPTQYVGLTSGVPTENLSHAWYLKP